MNNRDLKIEVFGKIITVKTHPVSVHVTSAKFSYFLLIFDKIKIAKRFRSTATACKCSFVVSILTQFIILV